MKMILIDKIMNHLNTVMYMDDSGYYHLIGEYNDLEDKLRELADEQDLFKVYHAGHSQGYLDGIFDIEPSNEELKAKMIEWLKNPDEK
jgi:hypothetical protein